MRRAVDVVLFDGFELLDVFGPVELLGCLPEEFSIRYVAEAPGAVQSSQGAQVIATEPLSSLSEPDLLLVPGGAGTRRLVEDPRFLDRLTSHAEGTPLITSVCTGSAVLAAAGLLDGYRATSNKMAFRWATQFGRDVNWVAEARWVHDRSRWTSSGVSAGMDMAVALIADLLDQSTADAIARAIEFEPHRDPAVDPFATLYDLSDTDVAT